MYLQLRESIKKTLIKEITLPFTYEFISTLKTYLQVGTRFALFYSCDDYIHCIQEDIGLYWILLEDISETGMLLNILERPHLF